MNSTARVGELQVEDIKKLLSNQGLDTSGSKEVLVQRLNESRRARGILTDTRSSELGSSGELAQGQGATDIAGNFLPG